VSGAGQAHTFLIGGTSHAGKSTVARVLAGRLMWSCLSTDTLARHPGRPWRAPPETVPAHVAEHYLELDGEALMASVLAHYARLWPRIEGLARARVDGLLGLVIEGSAVMPEHAAGLQGQGVHAVWLVADPGLIEARIRQESGWSDAGPEQRRLIGKFIERSVRFDALIRAEVARLGLTQVAVEPEAGAEALAGLCLERLTA
jgi:hypothetical protein